MTESKVQAPLRILNLALNLVNTRIGLSLPTLVRIVPGYLPADPASARRTFERDIDQLRKAGLVVEVHAGSEGEPVYRIEDSSFPPESAELSSQEVALLLRAASAWGEGEALSEGLRHKLRGYAPGPLPEITTAPRANLEGTSDVDIVLGAIETGRALEFTYSSRKGSAVRSVAPWRIVVRGRALYLWAFDLDRWEPRLFRFSRFSSSPRVIGEEGTVAAEGRLAEAEFERTIFDVAPLLWVRSGAAPLCEAQSKPVESEEEKVTEVPENGWRVRRGLRDDVGTWESRILREADAVGVIEPLWFADLLRSRLQVAAGWGEGAGA